MDNIKTTKINREKLGKYVGGTAVLLIGGFFMLGIAPNMDVQAGKNVSDVQVAKEAFFNASDELCEAKKVEYTEAVLAGEGSAEHAGKQIDMLKTQDGCKRFNAQVLLDEVSAVSTTEEGKK